MLTAKPAMSTAKRRPAGQESYRNQQLSPNNQKRNELRKSIEKANRDRSHVTGNSHRGLPERWRNNPQPIQLETSIYFGYIWFRQTDERHTCCRHRRNTGLLNNGISNEHVSQIFLAGYIPCLMLFRMYFKAARRFETPLGGVLSFLYSTGMALAIWVNGIPSGQTNTRDMQMSWLESRGSVGPDST